MAEGAMDTRRVGVRATPSLVVVLDRNGLRIPGRTAASSLPLDRERLLLLERLAPGSTPAGEHDPDDPFLEALRREGLVHDDDGDLEPPVAREAPGGPPLAAMHGTTGPGTPLMADVPLVFRLGAGGFELLDHVAHVQAACHTDQLLALREFASPATVADAADAHRARPAPEQVPDDTFDALVAGLGDHGLISAESAANFDSASDPGTFMRHVFQAALRLGGRVDQSVAAHEKAERERAERTGIRRTRVVPVAFEGQFPPLALGLITAYAMDYDGGRLSDHYHFPPAWITDAQRIGPLVAEPCVVLVSNYLWSHARCLEISAQIKQASPHSVIIHGGPDTPKYRGDVERYFELHPDVDVTVRGEGEATTAEILDRLAGAFADGPPDLERLRGVAGISFRLGDTIVHEPDRERLADLNVIPSPLLTGLFDAWQDMPGAQVVLETNRGCPYGCTFCDWGSATASRIRKFDLDRVFAELEWCARAGIGSISVADANFGIFARDVEIAERLVELKAEYGVPQGFGMSFAKNTVKHVGPIVTLLRDASILTMGILALQSMDQTTLDAIQRSNIKLEKYEELADHFRRLGLPLFVELIMGLPGATPDSFRDDLQLCIDREVPARINVAELLPNSPMNEPAYRERFAIETDHPVLDPTTGSRVVATSSYSRADHDAMDRLRTSYTLCEDYGVLRQLARFVRQEAGVREIDFYDRLGRDARDEPHRWPVIGLTLERVPQYMAPPASWKLLADELRGYLVDRFAVADDRALADILAVQLAVLPAKGREYPATLALNHDVASWWSAILEQKRTGNADWPSVVGPLRSFPPASFTVDDPRGLVTQRLGQPFQMHSLGSNWELRSPVTRGVTDDDLERVDAHLASA